MVLVVEDDPDIREILVDELTAEGFDVTPAEHGEAALRAVAAASPSSVSVVVTDLMMPYMDGATFISRLRGLREYARVPIIVVTASAVLHVPGANLVFRKPFDLAELLRAVSRFAEPGDGASPHA
jgi:DNA-binding response OmpR family regulator